MTTQTMIDEQLITEEALSAVPDFYDLPDELTAVIEKATERKERLFWMRAAHIEQTAATITLLRRAMYAEARCWEMENRLAEVSLVAAGLKAEVERLQGVVTDTAKGIAEA